MKKYSYLIRNIGLLTISSFGTKLISFFLVRLYTSVLSTAEYGKYDLFNTTISLLVPILTVNIQDSVLRFSLNERDQEKNMQIFSFGLQLVGISSLLVCLYTWLNSSFGWVGVIREYPVFFVLLYAANAFNQIYVNFARGMDRIADVSVAGVISGLTGCLLNIWLLLGLHLGLRGYFIAMICAAAAPCVYLSLRLHLSRYFRAGGMQEQLRREMLLYSAPMVFNAIGWWVNNASDRYIVTWLCGVAVNGIYSVGYKIPSILNAFQTIFNQAWVLSSVKEFDPEDRDGFFVQIYNVYECLMVGVCAVLIVLTRPLARFLYAREFYRAWQYVPFLTISIVFGALCGLIGGVFAAAKDSRIFSVSTVIGAVVNTVLNVILVLKVGAVGAAVATLISYIVVWAIRLRCVRRHMTLRIRLGRDIASYLGLGVLTLLLYLPLHPVTFSLCSALVMIVLLGLYRKEVQTVVKKMVRR